MTGGFTGDEDWFDNDWPEEYDDDGSSELGAALNFVGDTMADLSEAFYHISEIVDNLLIDEYDHECESDNDEVLEFVTYNTMLHKPAIAYTGPERIEAIFEAIGELDPDVVCLQEVFPPDVIDNI